MGLEVRFLIAILVCLVVGTLVAGAVSYRIEQDQAMHEVALTTDLLLDTATAIREHTIEEVRPLINAEPSDEFHPQTVPSYAAQVTLKRIQKKFPDFTYREAALNPTNVDDRATDWEVSIVKHLRENPTIKELAGVSDNREAEYYYMARPIRVSKQACLVCHSTPDKAPEAMINKYGSAYGFGWKLNEIVGAQIVEVPIEKSKQAALNSLAITLGSLVSIFLLTGVVMAVMFRHHVSRPLNAITQLADDISLGKTVNSRQSVSEAKAFSKLHQAIERLRVSVDHAVDLANKRKL